MTIKPRIIITLDAESPGGYSKMPWYALRQNYCDAVVNAGGMPILIPHNLDLLEQYVSMADGFVFTGGAFDIDPALYGITERHETVVTKVDRTTFEWRLMQLGYETKRPILGICGGMQLINVVLGGSLIQHIPAEVQNSLVHEQPNPRNEPGHAVQVHADTLLYQLIDGAMNHGKIDVNTAHHQAIKNLGKGVAVNALAEDGIVEGIEVLNHPFCLGVQWHPEYHVCEADKKIFEGFIRATLK